MLCLAMQSERLPVQIGVAQLFEAGRALRQVIAQRLSGGGFATVADRIEYGVMLPTHAGRMLPPLGVGHLDRKRHV